MARTKRPNVGKQLKGKNRVLNEVVEVVSATIDDEVPSDLPMQTRGAAKLRVSTGSEVDMRTRVCQSAGRTQRVDRPGKGQIKFEGLFHSTNRVGKNTFNPEFCMVHRPGALEPTPMDAQFGSGVPCLLLQPGAHCLVLSSR